MKITINDGIKIFSIQEEFNTVFPYLKLEFFSKRNKPGESTPKTAIRSSALTLGECRTIHNNGNVNIIPTMTVADLEKQFEDVYGLQIQLHRKSGKVWLETTVTEGWTLEEQNRQGEALSKSVI